MRFMLPHRGPRSEDSKTGMEISYTRVSIWPMLGLSERLAKALGPEFAGGPMHDDPDHIGFWGPLVKPPPSPTCSQRCRVVAAHRQPATVY